MNHGYFQAMESFRVVSNSAIVNAERGMEFEVKSTQAGKEVSALLKEIRKCHIWTGLYLLPWLPTFDGNTFKVKELVTLHF